MALQFSAYLWGIETSIQVYAQSGQFSVFSIPMRDWNKMRSKRNESCCVCFQHTYEGLKHVQSNLASASNVRVFSIPMRDWNLFGRLMACAMPSVFSIPMRDWNTLIKMKSGIQDLTFSAYLWGIETEPALPFPRWCAPRFQHTYEGLKPVDERDAVLIGLFVFSIPMRDWNIRKRSVMISPPF